MFKGVFPDQLQNKEVVPELWIIFNSAQSESVEASDNSKQLGSGCYRKGRALSLSLFKVQLTEERQHKKKSLEGRV